MTTRRDVPGVPLGARRDTDPPSRPGPGARLAVVGVVASAVTVAVLAWLLPATLLPGDTAPGRSGPAVALLLLVAAALHTEIVRVLDGRRRLAARRPHVDAAATWSFAAVLLLGLPLALTVTALVSADAWWRSSPRRPVRSGLAGVAVSVLASAASGAVLAALSPAESSADALRHDPLGPVGLAVLLAALVRWAVHVVLVTVAAAADPAGGGAPGRRSPRASSRVELALSAAATAVGLAAGEIAVRSPWVLGVLVLPLAAIHRETQLHELGRLAATDEKTDLVTAASWRREAQRLLARARRHRRPRAVGILMIDLDEFKAVNDRHGHITGDAVLAAVARALRDELRPVDLAGRFGGEEFVVALAGLDARGAADHAMAVAERVRRRVHTVALDLADSTTLGDLSVSVGVAVHPGDGATLDDLVLAADAALYTAKRTGRDRVCRAGGA